MSEIKDWPHEPIDEHLSKAHRYTCLLCGAVVSIPVELLRGWNRRGILAQMIQAELTKSLLMRTGHEYNPNWPAERKAI